MVRKVLSIIFGAKIPLTLTEMNEAVNFDASSQTIDLETNEDFKSRLRSWCGLFISIYDDHVYFLHQTAREFLQQSFPSEIITTTSERWQHSISAYQAEEVLMEICQSYLIYVYNMMTYDGKVIDWLEVEARVMFYTFLDYAAEYGPVHVEEFRTLEAAALPRSVLLPAAPMEVSEKLNALATIIGDFYCWGDAAQIFEDDTKYIFEYALWIAKMAIYSMPQDHPSRDAMLDNYDYHQEPQPDLTKQLDSIFQRPRKILEVTPRNHPDRGKLLQSLADCLRDRPFRTTSLNDNFQAIAILGEVIFTTPLDHPDRLILLNSLGDCLSKPYITWDRGPKYSSPQALRILWKSISMIPPDHPDRLIIFRNISDSLAIDSFEESEP